MTNDLLYYAVSRILRSVLAKEQSLRNAVYSSNFNNKKSLLRLCCETLRFRYVFDDLLKDSELSTIPADPVINGDIYLTYVLFYEFLIGAGLGKASAGLKTVVYKHSKAIHKCEKLLADSGRGIAAVRENEERTEFTVAIPRYARINTLKWTAKEAIEKLINEDWKVSFLTAEDDLALQVRNMNRDQVFVDPHIENLLIFPQSNDFYRYWLVEQRYLILQDKASCLTAQLLSPSPDSHVFDSCAAPGMKTSHVAAILGGGGKVWAMDRSEQRVQTMKKLLKQCGAENVAVLHGDFLKVDINDEKFAKVEYALVDPPCSGSGMVKRMDELTGRNSGPERLKKLKNLQAMILKHALKFPHLKKVVYSTCSLHEEENEQVVDEVMSDSYINENFRLAPSLLPTWKFRGLNKYKFGSKCLRADPEKTLTNGFFVAVFVRVVEPVLGIRIHQWNQESHSYSEQSEGVSHKRTRKSLVDESSGKVIGVTLSRMNKRRKKQSCIKRGGTV